MIGDERFSGTTNTGQADFGADLRTSLAECVAGLAECVAGRTRATVCWTTAITRIEA